MPRPTPDNIFLSTYTFRFREEEFNPIEISHSSWSPCAMVSTRGRTYDIPTATTAIISKAIEDKRPKNKQSDLGPKFQHKKEGSPTEPRVAFKYN